MDGPPDPVKFHVFGTFFVAGPDGRGLTPASEKGQALLALLVTAPQHKRRRSWLQDKLWSRSDPERGAANLRQVLATLRRALGPCAGVLQADRQAVWLDPALFTSDWFDAAGCDPETFLEGIDIDDPEFDAWLSQVRGGPAAATVRPPGPEPRPLQARRWRVALVASDPPDGLAAHLEAEILAFLSLSLMETGVVDIAAGRNDPLDPLAIDVALTITPLGDGRHGLRLSVIRPQRRRILWSTAGAIRASAQDFATDPSLMALVAAAQAAILREISRQTDLPRGFGDGATVLARSAHRVFSFDADTLARTDRRLADLEDGPERGVVLGMRAQIAVIRDIERLTDTPEACAEQGIALAARALEADPFNSQVLAAAANAQVFLRWNTDSAAELAEMALQTNRSNPLAWWAVANVALYTQAPDRALEAARTATDLARGTPLQFWCQFQLGLAALAAGRLELARRSLETSAAIAPSFRPPRRYLLALYSHLGQTDRAARMARELAGLEENFSLDAFARDHDYPVSLARRVGLIDAGAIGELERP